MQTENSVLSELKKSYQIGSMTFKLAFINVAVFIFIATMEVFSQFFGWDASSWISHILGMMTRPGDFITHPWGIFTYMFTHFTFWHLLFNLLLLYGAGRIFERFFDGKRLLYTYLLGGVFGGLFELLEYLLTNQAHSLLIGASGSVMAILVAVGFYQPNLKVSIWGMFSIRIIWIALIMILVNLYNAGMGRMDGTAYFAHLGGGLLGYLSIQRPFGANNIIVKTMQWGDVLMNFVGKIYRIILAPKKMKWSKKQHKASQSTYKTDEEYNREAKIRQQQIDEILDKISHSGYESLTKKEKEFLFRQSQR